MFRVTHVEDSHINLGVSTNAFEVRCVCNNLEMFERSRTVESSQPFRAFGRNNNLHGKASTDRGSWLNIDRVICKTGRAYISTREFPSRTRGLLCSRANRLVIVASSLCQTVPPLRELVPTIVKFIRRNQKRREQVPRKFDLTVARPRQERGRERGERRKEARP